MDWQKLLTDLTAEGWTQVEIAQQCGVGQATVSDLRNRTASPRYDFGSKLVQLHQLVCSVKTTA